MVFGEKGFVAFLADKVSSSLVRVHVFLQVVGLEEMFVALWALYLTFTGVGNDMQVEILKHELMHHRAQSNTLMTYKTIKICLNSIFKKSHIPCVRKHVLLQVMFPEERPVTEVTLELLCTSVNEHM